MGDWEEESPSEEENITEIENELYSMFYYHSMSNGIPDDLANKYNIDVNDFGATISLKHSSNILIENENDEENKCVHSESFSRADDRYIDEFTIINKNIFGNTPENDELEDFVKLPSLAESPKHEKSTYFSEVSNACSSPGVEITSKRKYKEKANINKKRRVDLNNSLNLSLMNLPCSTPASKSNNFSKHERIKQNKNKKKHDNTNDDDVIDLTLDNTSSKLCKKKIKADTISVVTISSSSSECNDSNESDLETSSESEYEIENSFDSILLNTTVPIDRNYCDSSIINTNYDWRMTSSPDGWTESMKKYYNKPSKKRLNFDFETIIQKMRREESADWGICRADYLNIRGPRKIRCVRCQQEGHKRTQCTKIFNCHMCGTSGHTSNKCPSKICLKCGSKHKNGFVDGCNKCSTEESPFCNVCGIQGHIGSLCTDAWRSFVQIDDNQDKEGPKYCCNCGKKGHTYEDCKRLPNSHPHQYTSFTPRRMPNKKKKNLRRKNISNKSKRKSNQSSLILEHDHIVPPSHKKSKYELRDKIYKSKKAKYVCLMSTNENIKHKKISKRLLMLRKSRRNKFKTRLSSTI